MMVAAACRVQAREIEAFRNHDALPLPADTDYTGMPALSKEEQELLTKHRPVHVHAASRIPGIRPSTLMLLFQIAKKSALTAAKARAGRLGGGGGGGSEE